jgi:hypothetical protein
MLRYEQQPIEGALRPLVDHETTHQGPIAMSDYTTPERQLGEMARLNRIALSAGQAFVCDPEAPSSATARFVKPPQPIDFVRWWIFAGCIGALAIFVFARI